MKSRLALREMAIGAVALIVVLAIPLFHRSPAMDSDDVSKSVSPQKAITRFPPRWRISPRACK